VYIIKRRPWEVHRRFSQFQAGEVAISALTAAELMYGVEKSERPEQNRAALQEFLLAFSIAPFAREAAEEYGRIRNHLKQAGTPIGPVDTFIAAHALSLGVPLVTNKIREFSRIPGLTVENWVSP